MSDPQPDQADQPLPIADLLHLDARSNLDVEAVQEVLELAFLGRDDGDQLDGMLDAGAGGGEWDDELFAADLFVRELIRDSFTLAIDGVRYPVNQEFLYGVLTAPPATTAAVDFRQQILGELDSRPELERQASALYRDTASLLTMFKSPDHAAQLDINAFRLDIFRQAKRVIDRMVDGFASAESGLHRLHSAGVRIQATRQYGRLRDLLDYEARQSTLSISLNVGGDGEVKALQIHDIAENRDNPFYTSHWRRWRAKLQTVFYGYHLSNRVIVNRILRQVFDEISESLVPLVQMLGHLELYLAARAFRDRMEQRGLATCLPEMEDGATYRIEGLFNPLLILLDDETPVPCDVETDDAHQLTLITGPNSGGKTRLLQSLGLAQLLGQSGLYVPAASARLPMVRGMFVSLVETETVDQAEGRLGRELLRIRRLFSTLGSPSLVVLDELCSGTNPSEGVEIFDLVLRLLDQLEGVAFISTHFLDFARQLETDGRHRHLAFLRVESDSELSSTYQFVPGVATTSLAAETARRLGVTFDDLSKLIARRRRT